MLGYSYVSKPITIVGTDTSTTVKFTDMATLADGYATGRFGNLTCGGGVSKVNFYIVYKMGASETSNSLDFKVESAANNAVIDQGFYQFVNDSASGGTSTLTRREFTIVGSAAATISFGLPLDVQDEVLKISFKETGVVTNFGSVHCQVKLFGSK